MFVTEYEVCIDEDEDEYDYLDGEFVETNNIWGYRAICPKNSQTTTVTIKYYYHAPTSEWYWEYNYDVGYKPIIPLVYSCDDNWNLVSCLNQSYYEYSLAGHADGWISVNATLSRKLVEGEKIFFGVYSDLLGVSVMWESDLDTTMCYFYFSTERRRNYNSPIEYLTSTAFKNKIRGLSLDYEACIYMEYENEANGIAYSRSVLGNVGASAIFANRKLVAQRTLLNISFLSDIAVRRLTKLIANTENLGLFDEAQKLLLLLRLCLSAPIASDSLKQQADYKRLPESIIDDEELIIRSSDNFRSFTDEIDLEALPFASRLFFRTIQTVMNFWDWLRGKIREANNVASFYCPIWTEIELECRI